MSWMKTKKPVGPQDWSKRWHPFEWWGQCWSNWGGEPVEALSPSVHSPFPQQASSTWTCQQEPYQFWGSSLGSPWSNWGWHVSFLSFLVLETAHWTCPSMPGIRHHDMDLYATPFAHCPEPECQQPRHQPETVALWTFAGARSPSQNKLFKHAHKIRMINNKVLFQGTLTKVIFFIWGGSGFWSMCSGGGSRAGIECPAGGLILSSNSWSIKSWVKNSWSHSWWAGSGSPT